MKAMDNTRTYHVEDRDGQVSIAGYWSRTWDVLIITGDDEDDAHVEVIARFESEKHARHFVETADDNRYVVGVRPPADIVRAGFDWVNLVMSTSIETLQMGGNHQ